MDYYRKSVAKSVNKMITLTEIRYFFKKYKPLIATDEGLLTLFMDRVKFIRDYSNCKITYESMEDLLLDVEVVVDEISSLTPHEINLIRLEWII